MAVAAEWFNVEHTIIRCVQAAGRGVNHRVDIVIDLTQMRGGTLRANENWGMGVFVGSGPFIKALRNTFTRVCPKMGERDATADTLEDAQRLLIEQRSRE